jgi:hypothetical protein
MLRLLDRARVQSADPELFAGLVQACRYAGLDRPAIAAHDHARRLDSQIRTAVGHAYFMAGEYERAIETDQEDPRLLTALSLEQLGRRGEALAHLEQQIVPGMPPLYRLFLQAMHATIDGRRDEARQLADDVLSRWRLRDPCATYYFCRTLANLEHPQALTMFGRAVEGGFHSYSFFSRDPWLDPLRRDPGFAGILAAAENGYQQAAAGFVAAGGERILGPLAEA